MKDQIKSVLIPVTFLPPSHAHGYANGYVGVPPGHPWFGKSYDEIDDKVTIHGGLTYGRDHLPLTDKGQQPVIDGLFWFGFDTCHCDDNKFTCDETYCQKELESLRRQAEEACQ